jgi:xanthine dehydrogenase accessory factor
MPSDLEFLNHAAHLLENQTKLALCTVVEKKGSGPRDVGAKMIVTEDGKTYGTIGGGNLERSLIDECISAIKEGKSKKVTFNLTKAQKEGMVATGSICGGELTVLADILEPVLRLVIVGSGHVALPLATLAGTVGLRVVIVDDESKLVGKDRFPMAEVIVSGNYEEVLGNFAFAPSDFVVVTHGEPEHDFIALKKTLEKNPAYVGLLGSKTKAAVLVQRLRAEGITEAQFKVLHAPLGLNIGAETPEEIAISILAQIIQIKRKP